MGIISKVLSKSKVTEIKDPMEDKYGLMRTVKVADVKDYLVKEYERANAKEEEISRLEDKIVFYEQIEMKYEAMLVVQRNTQERIERQDRQIADLKRKISELEEKNKALRAKMVDIKINAENKLKEKSKGKTPTKEKKGKKK